MQRHDSTRFNPNHHETPRTPYRIGRAGFEHPRELRLPMVWSPLRATHGEDVYMPRALERFRGRGILPSGLPLQKVREE